MVGFGVDNKDISAYVFSKNYICKAWRERHSTNHKSKKSII